MPLVKAGSAARLTPGSVVEVRAGERVLAVCNVEGSIHAMEGRCLHVGGPLGHGMMNGHHVVCPWHLWEFDCRTGEYDGNPAYCVPVYPVKIEGDDIWVEVPE
jgi:nitrite reductase/ring-hydroxylating ferredoxin subunit